MARKRSKKAAWTRTGGSPSLICRISGSKSCRWSWFESRVTRLLSAAAEEEAAEDIIIIIRSMDTLENPTYPTLPVCLNTKSFELVVGPLATPHSFHDSDISGVNDDPSSVARISLVSNLQLKTFSSVVQNFKHYLLYF